MSGTEEGGMSRREFFAKFSGRREQEDPKPSADSIYIPHAGQNVRRTGIPPTAEPTKSPTEVPPSPSPKPSERPVTPEPTRNPEILIELSRSAMVTWKDKPADVYTIARPIGVYDEVSRYPDTPLSCRADTQGTGWILTKLGEPVAYRFQLVDLKDNKGSDPTEVPPPIYFEMRYSELDKLGIINQLPNIHEHTYIGQRVVRKIIAENDPFAIANIPDGPRILDAAALGFFARLSQTSAQIPNPSEEDSHIAQKPFSLSIPKAEMTRRKFLAGAAAGLGTLAVLGLPYEIGIQAQEDGQDDDRIYGEMEEITREIPSPANIIGEKCADRITETPVGEVTLNFSFDTVDSDGKPLNDAYCGGTLHYWGETNGKPDMAATGIAVMRGTDGKPYLMEYTPSMVKEYLLHAGPLPDGKFTAALTFSADRTSYRVDVVTSEGKTVSFAKKLSWTMDRRTILSSNFGADRKHGADTRFSADVSFPASPDRLKAALDGLPGQSEDKLEDLQRIDELNYRSGSLMQLHPNIGMPTLNGDEFGASGQTVADWFDRVSIDANHILIHPGSLFDLSETDPSQKPGDRGREYWQVRSNDFNSPYKSASVLAMLHEKGISAIYVADFRVLPETGKGSASPVPVTATANEIANVLATIQAGRKVDSPLRVALHGFFEPNGSLGRAFSKLGNIQTLGEKLADSIPPYEDAVFDAIPYLSRETQLSAESINSIASALAIINKHPKVQIDRIMVSLTPNYSIDKIKYLGLLRQLVETLKPLGVSVDFDHANGGFLNLDDVLDLAAPNNSPKNEPSTVYFADPRKVADDLPNAQLPFATTKKERVHILSLTDEYDRLMSKAA